VIPLIYGTDFYSNMCLPLSKYLVWILARDQLCSLGYIFRHADKIVKSN